MSWSTTHRVCSICQAGHFGPVKISMLSHVLPLVVSLYPRHSLKSCLVFKMFIRWHFLYATVSLLSTSSLPMPSFLCLLCFWNDLRIHLQEMVEPRWKEAGSLSHHSRRFVHHFNLKEIKSSLQGDLFLARTIILGFIWVRNKVLLWWPHNFRVYFN